MQELWFRIKIFLVSLASLEKKSKLARYLLPVFLFFIALLFINFLPKAFFQAMQGQTIVFLVLISIVTISAWFGGFGPGILATFMTALIDYFILSGKNTSYHSDAGDFMLVVFYTGIGLIISTISEARYESENQKDEFLRIIAHELKNPLSVIKGFAELISRGDKKNGVAKMKGYAQNIKQQSDKLLDLINDLLDLTKIEIGKIVYNDEPFDFDQLVKEAISQQKVINKHRSIVLAGKSDKVIMGDSYRIRQVVTNLLTNALKYSPDGKRVEVKISNHPTCVILQVKDNGVGIPVAEQKRIFSRLYRTKGAKGSGVEGLGLGLYICSQIVKHHRGMVWVKSKEGHGSTFFLKLPSGQATQSQLA